MNESICNLLKCFFKCPNFSQHLHLHFFKTSFINGEREAMIAITVDLLVFLCGILKFSEMEDFFHCLFIRTLLDLRV